MSTQADDKFGYPGFVLEAIAQWITNYREALSTDGQLRECGPEEVAKISRDLMVSPRELAGLASKGPDAAGLLKKLLVALGVDASKLADQNGLVMRDLQRLCITCGAKRRCERELAKGTAAANYGEYCPNAYTLEALLKPESSRYFPAAVNSRDESVRQGD